MLVSNKGQRNVTGALFLKYFFISEKYLCWPNMLLKIIEPCVLFIYMYASNNIFMLIKLPISCCSAKSMPRLIYFHCNVTAEI